VRRCSRRACTLCHCRRCWVMLPTYDLHACCRAWSTPRCCGLLFTLPSSLLLTPPSTMARAAALFPSVDCGDRVRTCRSTGPFANTCRPVESLVAVSCRTLSNSFRRDCEYNPHHNSACSSSSTGATALGGAPPNGAISGCRSRSQHHAQTRCCSGAGCGDARGRLPLPVCTTRSPRRAELTARALAPQRSRAMSMAAVRPATVPTCIV
jgi:hypothetical protein